MSTLKVDTIQKADGTGSLSVPAESGTVVTTASPSLGRRNMVINGAMQVAQRGTSTTTMGIHTVDRWALNGASALSMTQSQQTATSSDAIWNYGFRNYARLALGATSSATNNWAEMGYNFEAQDLANSGWDYTSTSGYVTLSFWVRSSLAGTYSAYVKQTDGTSHTYSFQFTVAANTWTKVTHSIPGHASMQIDNDNGVGLALYVVPHYGTDYTTSGHTSEAWQTYSASDRMPDYAQDWGNTASSTFDLTGVQLEVGSVATPFEHRSYGEELALCQRYYYKYTHYGNNPRFYADNGGATYFAGGISFPTEMRAAPTNTTITAPDYSNCNTIQSQGTTHGQQFFVYPSAAGAFYIRNYVIGYDAEL